MFKKFLTLCLFAAILALAPDALAETVHWGGFPTPQGPIAEKVTNIYNFIFYIIALIALIVLAGLGYCVWKFRESKNEKPAKFSHSTVLEVVWTVIPALICVAIAIASYTGIKYIRTMPETGLTIEVIAFQFGWDFDYPDFDIASPEELEPHPQLSSAPGVERYAKHMVVPVGVPIKMHVTARDVIHSFYAPDVGVKIDAIPGRINYQWFQADREGEYIGQCSELCGYAHGEMFFVIKAVSEEEFRAWVNGQRTEMGMDPLVAKDFEDALI